MGPGRRNPRVTVSSLYMRAQSVSCVQLFATLCTVARQAPLSMGFSRQEYWSELPCPSPGERPEAVCTNC